ncbi:ICMT-domain-containing protein [Trametes coccinea BRFM310]|uniref:Protein-S-isoprenylcysteine O-methyltransferase n=1 Tax=Trametes coccinea (strain BRFM310) TaxID=1353009 RepID=A0A1Y2J4C1_TRAC3|nr:ICMT-domain-containing protein [Trametes coccinea BRFM310]
MLASTDPATLPGSVLLPLLKISALVATGYAVHRALSPPNPPPAPKTCIDNRTLFERAIRHVTFCSKMLTWTIVLCDALVTLHLAAPTPLTRPFASVLLPASLAPQPALSSAPPSPSSSASSSYPYPPPPAYSPGPSPGQAAASYAFTLAMTAPHAFLIIGTFMAVCGAALRLACFRALGALFTFELTISPTHTLVTDGPYAFVRHPSYAGVYAVLLGATAVMLAPGAWLREAWLGPSACAMWRTVIPTLSAYASANPSVSDSVLASSAPRLDVCAAGASDSVGTVGAVLAWAFVAFWTTKVVYALRSTNKRVGTEDAELHRVFGPQWEEWAGRVQWRLVPWLF